MLDKPITFLATDDAKASKSFYGEVLGLELVSDEPFALVFRSGGGMVRIQKMEQFDAAPHTVFGWEVTNIDGAVSALASKLVEFEIYPHFEQDANGVWTSPSGARVAWFKDPVGNVLSLTQPPA